MERSPRRLDTGTLGLAGAQELAARQVLRAHVPSDGLFLLGGPTLTVADDAGRRVAHLELTDHRLLPPAGPKGTGRTAPPPDAS